MMIVKYYGDYKQKIDINILEKLNYINRQVC